MAQQPTLQASGPPHDSFMSKSSADSPTVCNKLSSAPGERVDNHMSVLLRLEFRGPFLVLLEDEAQCFKKKLWCLDKELER